MVRLPSSTLMLALTLFIQDPGSRILPPFEDGPTMFWMAHQEGLVLNGTSVHAGLHTRLSGTDWHTYLDDDDVGFYRICAKDIDDVGAQAVISQSQDRIGLKVPVYLRTDINVLDPAFAPGTGAPESDLDHGGRR